MPATVQPARDGALRGLARRAPIALWLAGTFGWAWLLWGYWIPAMPPGGLQLTPAFLITAIVGGLAPSLAAIVVTALVDGRPGVVALLSPLWRWRGKSRYLLALAIMPVTAAVAAAIQGLTIGPPHLAGIEMVPVILVWPLIAGLGEEIGWRGYLLPRLQARLGALGAALVIGVIWGFWHLPADWIGLKAYGDWFVPAFLVNGPIVLTAHAIILTWLWNRTGGNLLLMVLYHFTITAAAMLVPSGFTDGARGVLAAAIGAGCVWVVAAALLAWPAAGFRPAASAGRARASA